MATRATHSRPAPDAAAARLQEAHDALGAAHRTAEVATRTAREAGDTAEYYREQAQAAYWAARKAGWSDQALARDGLYLLPAVAFRVVPASIPAPGPPAR